MSQPKLSSKQARWQEFLAEFNFMQEYCLGSSNHVADALSRRADLISICSVAALSGSAVTTNTRDQIRALMEKDPTTQYLVDLIKQECHDTSWARHPGEECTCALLQRVYYWPQMRDDIATYVKICLICQQDKANHQKRRDCWSPFPSQPDHSKSDIDYMKKGHLRYVFLSYVCLGMFKNFDMNDFGLGDSQVMCNGNGSVHGENSTIHDGYLRELIEHIASNPMEILSKNPRCEFSRFCEKKYEELIHPTMESSLFSNLDRKEKVLDSWKSLSVFYELFVRMASSIWLLHTLAYSFDPVVEIFQVERGIDFSMVYMEDVLGKCSFRGKTRPKVGFTVVPCFKVGRTVIQSQVYLTGLKGEE
ncbi:uncharacterized protein LOC111378881 [Olea europaea var. sylvestris]|uniref:uncharacterized protein LOC111378881 n=1 Tax=Olea europaea var. sylvestris TaxID=158386 RepID=UPI000C1D812A|nr:uncharacterized protein LOC111378881 [Olea europaea var. sylvestris]